MLSQLRRAGDAIQPLHLGRRQALLLVRIETADEDAVMRAADELADLAAPIRHLDRDEAVRRDRAVGVDEQQLAREIARLHALAVGIERERVGDAAQVGWPLDELLGIALDEPEA